MLVSGLMFSGGGFTFSREGRGHAALLCSIFFGVAILDLVPLLSCDGMPASFIPAKDGKFISFFQFNLRGCAFVRQRCRRRSVPPA